MTALQNIQPRRTPKNGTHSVILCVGGNPDFAYQLHFDLLKFGMELRHVWADQFDRLPIEKRLAPSDIDVGFVIKDNILSRSQREAAQYKIEKVSRVDFFEVPPHNKTIVEVLIQKGFFGPPMKDSAYPPKIAPRAGTLAKDIAPPSDTATPKQVAPKPEEKPTPSEIVTSEIVTVTGKPTGVPSDMISTSSALPTVTPAAPVFPDLKRLTSEDRELLVVASQKLREARAKLPGISSRTLGKLIDPNTEGTVTAQIERASMVPSKTMCEAVEIAYRLPVGTIPRLGNKDYSTKLNLADVRQRADAFYKALEEKTPLPKFGKTPAPDAPAPGVYYHHPTLVEPYRSRFAPIPAPADFTPTMSVTTAMKQLSTEERRKLNGIGQGLQRVRIAELKLSLGETWAIVSPETNNKSSLSQVETGAHRFSAPITAALEMLYGVPTGTIQPSPFDSSPHPFDLPAARERIAKWQIENKLAKPGAARPPAPALLPTPVPAAAPPPVAVAVPPPLPVAVVVEQPSLPPPPPLPPVAIPAVAVTQPASQPANDNAPVPPVVKQYLPNPPPSGSTLDEMRDWFDMVLRRLRNYMPQCEYTRVEMTAKQQFCEGSVASIDKTA